MDLRCTASHAASESHVLKRADAVVTICETLREELVPRSGRHDKVHVVANGVDVDSFRPKQPSEESRRKYGLAGGPLILYVGTFQPYEGLELLVRAFRRVRDRLPDAQLLIVGGSVSLAYRGATTTGTQEEVLARVIDDLRLREHVTMTGLVPHAEVSGLYSIADCVVYPRILTRTTALTTPLKPLEAMAMGRPVVVSDLPPMRELVRHGETGLTFPAGDEAALAQTCVDLLESTPSRREQLGRAARDYVVAERQWSHLVSRYRAVYENVLSPREKGPA